MILFIFLMLLVHAGINSNIKKTNFFNHFNTFENILKYLQLLKRDFPDKISLTRIGKTKENRSIIMVKIRDNKYDKKKPIILVDAGMHAREWMAPAVALYLINELVKNKANKHMTVNVDWYIIPLVNPDGYHYTHTGKRKWRKNRAEGHICSGVDLNRNFNVHWGEYGASANECSIQYAGPAPFSEPETRALKSVALHHKPNIKLYVNLHTYGNIVTYPWSWSKNLQLPINYEIKHRRLGKYVVEAIEKSRGSIYTSGKLSDVLYASSGTSLDWMFDAANIPLCFLIEIGHSHFRFQPPESEIMPTTKEIFEGFKVFHMYIEAYNELLIK